MYKCMFNCIYAYKHLYIFLFIYSSLNLYTCSICLERYIAKLHY